jgi:isoleucyl-tRNA synthetase
MPKRVILGILFEDGTGIVHTANFGADDAKVAKEATQKFPMLVLDENGTSVSDLQGKFC